MTLQPLSATVGADVTRWVEVLAPARQLAEVIAGTDFVPKAMRGKPDVVTAAIMYGDELGLGPMQALQGLDVIEGKPRPSSELQRALILRDGHSLTVHEMTGTRCRVSGLRAGRPESERVVVEWTHDMAKAAGLVGKSNWRAYPRAMLLARAMSDLARVLFPDVIKGLGYVAETDASLQAVESLQADDTEGAQNSPEPRRRAIGRKAPAPAQPPVAPPEPPPLPPTGPLPDGVVVVDQPPPHLTGDTPERPSEDEPPADGGVAMATVDQLNMLYTRLGHLLGTSTDSDQRRQVLADLVGRPLETAKELTREEAYAIRGQFMRVGAGVAALQQAPGHGAWQVVDVVVDPFDGNDPWAKPPPDDLGADPDTGELPTDG